MNHCESGSIFALYYSQRPFVDRFASDPSNGLDVIIPLYTVNDFFRNNLTSFYAEIPVKRLIVGDGGCSDATLDILHEFPRIEIIDQKKNRTLGYCLRQLIEATTTEWFVYLHADVFLPRGWFDVMSRFCSVYDWFECARRKTIALEYLDVWQNEQERPFSGSQMGRKKAFEPFLDRIEDDYLYRNEDIVLRDLVEKHGGKYARIRDTFHYHQFTNRFGLDEPDLAKVEITPSRSREWMQKTYEMQARGIIKYTRPGVSYLTNGLRGSLRMMDEFGVLDKKEFLRWTAGTNPAWIPSVKKMLRLHTGKTGKLRLETARIGRSVAAILRTLFGGEQEKETD